MCEGCCGGGVGAGGGENEEESERRGRAEGAQMREGGREGKE